MHNDSEEKREERWKGKEKDTDTSHVGKKSRERTQVDWMETVK